MGKGDKKSKRGKIIRGSFGVLRSRKTKHFAPAAPPVKVVTEKHTAAKAASKPEKEKIETVEAAKAEVILETHTEPKVATKPKPAVKAEVEVKAKAETKDKAEVKVKTEAKDKAKAEAKPAAKAAPKTAVKKAAPKKKE